MTAHKVPCKVETCETHAQTRGYCDIHYRRLLRHGDPLILKNRPSADSFCNQPDCLLPRVTRSGLCNTHRMRLRQQGDVNLTKLNRGVGKTVEERFWSRVAITADVNRCWDWQASLINGYAAMAHQINGRRTHLASHYAYFIFYKVDPGELCVLHKCDRPICVNPHHLFLGTRPDNVADMIAKGRAAVGELQPGAKLTDDLVRQIRSSNKTTYRLAKELGLSQSTVGRARKGKRWRHVQ